MYEHLSRRVNGVIKLAESIAREYEQDYVGTEHLLLAIIREGTGLGVRVLTALGVDEDRARGEVDRLIKTSLEDTWVFGRLPGSPHYRNVVAKAIEEARGLGNKEVCTEHLLLGLLAEKGSVAYQALRDMGVTADAIRQEILKTSPPAR